MTAFNGFGDKALPFLKALGFHQDRDWFAENKALYESEVKGPLGDLVEAVSGRFQAEGVPLRGSRKTSLYRVYRDVRFSRNKDPYNTHASALMTRTGTKKDNGFVYVHISNERSFIASGFYGLDGPQLRAFRDLIVRESDAMRRLVKAMEKHGFTLDMSESLKRTPRGFDDIDDDDVIAWLRLKHFTFIDEIDNGIVPTPELADRMVRLGSLSVPFLDFGWRAIDPLRDEPAS
ncbi:TIGR02453 family protein [Oceaniradius stylonematis]|uniref:TIGR02453 family protein n=1 Tax=Oceaniradius stylonematis TaxID=2184161 RepID=A0A3A8AG41_9HYPH|nr:TIGR02453 family protein [Oceaniradius stylonematis]RKF08049.1 TIGR02453 family protein [Oceaniradius stylonematis]